MQKLKKNTKIKDVENPNINVIETIKPHPKIIEWILLI